MTKNLILTLLSAALFCMQVMSLSAATENTESNIDPKSLFMKLWWDESINNDPTEMSMNAESWKN